MNRFRSIVDIDNTRNLCGTLSVLDNVAFEDLPEVLEFINICNNYNKITALVPDQESKTPHTS